MATPDAALLDSGIYDTDQPSLEAVKRHDEFYISDGGNMSIFLVGRTLYRVHRYFLARESLVFRSMFDCPHPGAGQDGESDEKPIHLPDLPCSQFEALLDFLYNGMFVHEGQKSESTRRSLYDLLSISLRFEFDRVTAEVVARIDDCVDNTDAVTKICFGVVHDALRHWVPPAYTALVERDHFLTKDEIMRLGAGRTAIVGSMREQTREQKPTTPMWRIGPPVTPVDTMGSELQMVNLDVPVDFYSV